MTWRPNGVETASCLHLRLNPNDPWQPYSEFPEYALPDPSGFSPGYATCLDLLKKQWEIL
ncbi:MAG: hypothetical protein D6756_11310 [Cyanobacteria bacterium J083]|nr:MAG: hypothetical protein D6756_11310 [Cyanobacteria bacterium J083]